MRRSLSTGHDLSYSLNEALPLFFNVLNTNILSPVICLVLQNFAANRVHLWLQMDRNQRRDEFWYAITDRVLVSWDCIMVVFVFMTWSTCNTWERRLLPKQRCIKAVLNRNSVGSKWCRPPLACLTVLGWHRILLTQKEPFIREGQITYRILHETSRGRRWSGFVVISIYGSVCVCVLDQATLASSSACRWLCIWLEREKFPSRAFMIVLHGMIRGWMGMVGRLSAC